MTKNRESNSRFFLCRLRRFGNCSKLGTDPLLPFQFVQFLMSDSSKFSSIRLITVFLVTCLVMTGRLDAVQEELSVERVDFRSKVLPIFEQHCLDCHSEDNVEGNLDLLSQAAIQNGGFSGLPIVHEDLGKSELILRIESDDPNYQMPKDGEKLSGEQIEIIRAWVAQVGRF